MRTRTIDSWAVLAMALAIGTNVSAKEPDEVGAAALGKATPRHGGGRLPPARQDQARVRPGLQGIDSLANFTGSFKAPGFDAGGNYQDTWQYAMVGSDPARARTTEIGAPIIAVNVELLDWNGGPRFVGGKRLLSDATQYMNLVRNSPVFRRTRYSSSEDPTQFADAVHRAQFWGAGQGRRHRLDDDWHTMLRPRVETTRTLKLPRGSYQFALNNDGTCCAFILADEDAFVAGLFPSAVPDHSTVIGAAEVDRDISTRDLSTFLFPNTFLYANGDPNDCCVLGFHSFDFEPGDKKNGNLPRFFVMNYSSWITPGLFGGGFEDVTALSHEVCEIYSNPFVDFDGVHNVTPWWLSPWGLCQNDLEVGDVIEGLNNASFPITIDGFTYHPQNEALLSWFAQETPSTGFDHAYSYPDTTLLMSAATPQNFQCQ